MCGEVRRDESISGLKREGKEVITAILVLLDACVFGHVTKLHVS